MLSGLEIIEEVRRGNIVIDPFNERQINPNSYNLRLDKRLLVYCRVTEMVEPASAHRVEPVVYDPRRSRATRYQALDMKIDNLTNELIIPEEGLVLVPGVLYLGATKEYTETHGFAPMIEGRSSVARLGCQVHLTAGFGDTHFQGCWTLELSVIHPLRVYAEVEICQIAYQEIKGEKTAYCGKYQGHRGPRSSGLWKEFVQKNQP
jgi:dCTP deaminase